MHGREQKCQDVRYGVPVVAQRLRNLPNIIRMQVPFLASLSGFSCCRELWCRSQMKLGTHIAVAVGRPVATVLIRPLAWEPPYAISAALKKKKKKKKKAKDKKKKKHRCLGVPVVVQWKLIQLVSMRILVQSLASLRVALSCGVGP